MIDEILIGCSTTPPNLSCGENADHLCFDVCKTIDNLNKISLHSCVSIQADPEGEPLNVMGITPIISKYAELFSEILPNFSKVENIIQENTGINNDILNLQTNIINIKEDIENLKNDVLNIKEYEKALNNYLKNLKVDLVIGGCNNLIPAVPAK